MAREATCPVCNAYIPIDEKEVVGNYVYCSYCNTQLMIKKDKDEENQELELEEDWGEPPRL